MSAGSLNETADLPLDFLLLPGDGLLLVNAAGIVSWLDRWAERILGVRAEDWMGQPLQQHWPDLAQELERLPLTLDGGHRTLRFSNPDHNASLSLRLFRSDHGVGIGLVQHQAVAEIDQPLVQLLCSVIDKIGRAHV